MNTVVDIGNTFTKIIIFENNDIKEKYFYKSKQKEDIKKCISRIKNKYENTENIIISTVQNTDKNLENFLKENFINCIIFNEKTKLPIKNLYKTPETLGKDRIAATVAASNIFPNCNVLIFDAGTALTVDFINNKKEYKGGSISPGLEMRYKALNLFTDKLPKIKINENFENIYGNNTENSIISGVQNGILYETEGHIKRFSEKYNNLKVTFTGGDAFFFEKKLKKNKIFVKPDLVSTGLNLILEYNVK